MPDLLNQIKTFVVTNKLYLVISSILIITLIIVYLLDPRVKDKTDVVIAGQAVEEATIQDSKIVVDVSGAVGAPGVYTLDPTARIWDAIKEAGGFTNEADVQWIYKNINLALSLEDAQKVYVPFYWDVQNSQSVNINVPITQGKKVKAETTNTVQGNSEVAIELINVNQASAEELKSLKGIGEVYSSSIINNRPYQDIEEFRSKAGIPGSTIDKLEALITF